MTSAAHALGQIVARYTSPMPPTPIWAVTSYGPRRVPGTTVSGLILCEHSGGRMQPRKLLARVSRGDVQNVAFADFCRLVEAFGFANVRTEGSHQIYAHPAVVELVNLQEVGRQAKPYQIRQVLRLVERYNLKLGDKP